MSHQLTNSLKAGLEFLKTQQHADGSFISLSSPHQTHFSVSGALPYTTTFTQALILESLSALPFEKHQTTLRAITQPLARFLLAQKSPDWTFNYWPRTAPQALTKPYPDDLDDTFCSLVALYHYQPTLVSGEVLAKSITVLTTLEAAEGGPYRTWLVPDDAPSIWLDVDLAVNANIAYFLHLQEVELENLNSFFEQKITRGLKAFTSPYYPTPAPLLYFLARAYHGPHLPTLQKILLSELTKKTTTNHPLKTALLLNAALMTGIEPSVVTQPLDKLLASQADGSWPAEAFCLDPSLDSVKYYAGSASLTTAFALEALNRVLHAFSTQSNSTHLQAQTKLKQQAGRVYDQVVKTVKTRVSSIPEPLDFKALAMLDKIVEHDHDQQIVLLPFFFRDALGPAGKKIPDSLVIQLGSANLLGWIAYTIYDDFLDEEGTPEWLSVANVCLRELTQLFSTLLPPKSGFPTFFNDVMDQLDAANTWEVLNCRAQVHGQTLTLPAKLPEYDSYLMLADRSLGHALGPVAELLSLGYSVKSPEVKHFWNFACHYLTARQLNDDAHDWEKDLQRGQLTAIATNVLQHWREQQVKQSSQKKLDLTVIELTPDLLLSLRRSFWYDLMPSISEAVIDHAEQAEGALRKCRAITQPGLLLKLVAGVRKTAEVAQKERQKMIEFLGAYSS
jgi:hypothetical protein